MSMRGAGGKSDEPLVSVVIPAYNYARYLPEAIDSVLNQEYPNIELIVLDDGSTDRTIEVLKGYGDQFYWESHPNMGQANTLNKGWRLAKGEILAYLSADDFLLPEAVSACVECLRVNADAVLCYPDFQLVDSESRVVRFVVPPEYSYQEMVTKFVTAPSAGAFFRRSAYVKAGEWDPALRLAPDYDYWLRLGLNGRFVHIQENLAAFRAHADSQSFSQTTAEGAEEAVRILEKYFKRADLPREVIGSKDEAFASANILVAQLHLRSSRYKEAFRRISNAVRLSPRILLSIRTLRMMINGLFNKQIHKVLWTIKNYLGRKDARSG
jgi:glycosyltransferase involved in cell wall biosynthesis